MNKIDKYYNNVNTHNDDFSNNDMPIVYEEINDMGFDMVEALDIASASVESITKVVADMNVQIAEVRAQVEIFSKMMDTDLEKYKQRLPIMEKQLDRASKRIDNLVDKILDDNSPMTTEYLQKQSILLEALTKMSNDYNSIIASLL
jgi:predicted amino acid-binding ACT domain protein